MVSLVVVGDLRTSVTVRDLVSNKNFLVPNGIYTHTHTPLGRQNL